MSSRDWYPLVLQTAISSRCFSYTHTNAISAQNEEVMELTGSAIKKIERKINKEETKKDRTKKLHPSIVKIIGHVSAKSSTDESEAISATCTYFLDSVNVGMAQYKLVQQFKELGFPDISFAQGTAQALYSSNFLYADSSTPSNFTVFAFHKQEPLLDSHQTNYLICQLVQTQGQKKLLDETNASLKQTVHVPTNFNSMGTQLQLFAARCKIFFWHRESLLHKSEAAPHHNWTQQEDLLGPHCFG
jgi:hypothetical protein